jgi:thioesterase domain-containing protein
MKQIIELQRYLHNHIPMTEQMGLVVKDVSNTSVALAMPLDKNTNHQGTAFAGSISSLGLISGWATLWHFMHTLHGLDPTVVAKSSETLFKQPITSDFEAYVVDFDNDIFLEFLRAYTGRAKGQMSLTSHITTNGKTAAIHNGVFVALPSGV